MPIHKGYDRNKKKFYYQFGETGKKYYFSQNEKSRDIAYSKALRQARAIEFSKHIHGGDY